MADSTEYTVVDLAGDYDIHKVGCRDIARNERKGLVTRKWNIEVPNGEDIARAAALDMECGQADDHDMTPEEYVDEFCLAYDVRVYPCCKAA